MSPAEPRGGVRNLVEDRLQFRLRLADDIQHLGRRRLALQRLRKVRVRSLQRPELANVLDGDGGLGGEGLHQIYMVLGERPYLAAIEREYADRLGFGDQWDVNDRPDPLCIGSEDVVEIACLIER